jgi:hypothetical protein
VKPILRPTGISPLAHLPYCSSHAVSIVEIERRKARREWRDLVAGIQGGQRFGSNGLQFGQGVYITVGHYDNMRVDSEKYSTKSFGVNYSGNRMGRSVHIGIAHNFILENDRFREDPPMREPIHRLSNFRFSKTSLETIFSE